MTETEGAILALKCMAVDISEESFPLRLIGADVEEIMNYYIDEAEGVQKEKRFIESRGAINE